MDKPHWSFRQVFSTYTLNSPTCNIVLPLHVSVRFTSPHSVRYPIWDKLWRKLIKATYDLQHEVPQLRQQNLISANPTQSTPSFISYETFSGILYICTMCLSPHVLWHVNSITYEMNTLQILTSFFLLFENIFVILKTQKDTLLRKLTYTQSPTSATRTGHTDSHDDNLCH
jgi:hypothetical protein